MRKTMIVMLMVVGLALVASGAFAVHPYGNWDFNVESYYSWDPGAGLWRYDYTLWYEQWNAAEGTWMGTGDAGSPSGIDQFSIELPPSLALGTSGWGQAPLVLDNVNFNGAFSWEFAGIDTNPPGHPGLYSLVWTPLAKGSVLTDSDAAGMIDDIYPERYDPAVRTTKNGLVSYLEGLGLEDVTACPNNPDLVFDPSNSAQTALTGYDRPIGHFWFYSPGAPGTTNNSVLDGSDDNNQVCGPTPELGSMLLLLSTLAPAGFIFRRRRS